ncbi:MAG: sensor histidine kinase [Sphingomonadaceae bacterium]
MKSVWTATGGYSSTTKRYTSRAASRWGWNRDPRHLHPHASPVLPRHAGAHAVQLVLRRSARNLQLSIQDDGRGIAEQDMDKAASFGLVGMRERVWAIHGDIAITSNGGTLISISLPLPPSNH